MDTKAASAQIPKIDENAFASRRNPIIGETQGDTLFQAACLAGFLGRYHSDRADWLNQAEASNCTSGPDSLSGNEERGLSLVCESLAAALWFELEGRV